MSDGPHDPYRDERRKILRRAALYTYGLLAAAVLVAVVGAAVVAWILSFAGLPFRETWLILTVIILGVPLIGRIAAALRKRIGRRADDTGGEDRPPNDRGHAGPNRDVG